MAVELLPSGTASIALLLCWWVTLRGRSIVRGTTLGGPWKWLIAGLTLWSIAWAATAVTIFPTGIADRLAYFAAIALLAPAIAVLGARRPGAAAWGWFVVLPMLCVLGLPALTGGGWSVSADRLRVETPPLLGVAIVMLMGIGNYVGTRFTLPALLFASALGLQLVPSSDLSDHPDRAAYGFRVAAMFSLAAAAWLADRASRRRPVSADRRDALWIEFRDLFGIVWAKRVLERVNHSATTQNWPVRLHMHGFAPLDETNTSKSDTESASAIDPETEKRIEDLFRWLLKRFVDEEWLDRRLTVKQDPPRKTAK